MEAFKTNAVLGYRTAGSRAEWETGEMLLREMQALGLRDVHKDRIRVDGWEFEKAVMRFTDGQGQEHEVWFEDARSIKAKLALAQEYGLYGVGYWNLMRPFPQNWTVLNSLYHIREELSSGTGFFSSSAV